MTEIYGEFLSLKIKFAKAVFLYSIARNDPINCIVSNEKTVDTTKGIIEKQVPNSVVANTALNAAEDLLEDLRKTSESNNLYIYCYSMFYLSKCAFLRFKFEQAKKYIQDCLVFYNENSEKYSFLMF